MRVRSHAKRTPLAGAVSMVLLPLVCCEPAAAKAGKHWWLVLGTGDEVRAAASKCAVRRRMRPLPHRADGFAAGTLALGPFADRGTAVAERRLTKICLPQARIVFSAR